MVGGNTQTTESLAAITDPGVFERLFIAVLREENPEEYGALFHTGITPKGKTQKAPLDGIYFSNNTMIAVQCTITASKSLDNKLFSKSKKAPGDIIKTSEIYNQEKKKNPKLQCRLILAFNTEPSNDTASKICEFAQNYNIQIDAWGLSSIAHFLDYDTTGQYIRYKFLGIPQELLSPELLNELSSASLRELHIPSSPAFWITRSIDVRLRDSNHIGLLILSAKSGYGKSVVCHKFLNEHINKGGYGIVLTDSILSQSDSLFAAIALTLKNLHPHLHESSVSDALSLAKPRNPFVIIVEDVNKSTNPQRLLEKLLSWHQASCNDGEFSQPILIICPIQPRNILGLDSQLRELADRLTHSFDVFSRLEGREAVKAKYRQAVSPVTDYTADEIAKKLGYDPLLIALHDINDNKDIDANQAIGQLITQKLELLSNNSSRFVSADYMDALSAMMIMMYENRQLAISWRDVGNHNFDRPETIDALRVIGNQREIFNMEDCAGNTSIVFRHDRVRDWLAANAISQSMQTGDISDDCLAEPFFAEAMGHAICDSSITESVIGKIKLLNPLALFFALKEFGEAKTKEQIFIVDCIKEWLTSVSALSPSNKNLIYECSFCLAQTDSSHVRDILSIFPGNDWFLSFASFRNGDITGGIDVCAHMDIGRCYANFNSDFNKAIEKYNGQFASELQIQLKNATSEQRSGMLRLAGYLQNPILQESVRCAWAQETDETKTALLNDYFFAGLYCSGDNPEKLLGYILTSELISKVWNKENEDNTRNYCDIQILKNILTKVPPTAKIVKFLISLAINSGNKFFENTTAYLLHGVDCWIAFEYVLDFCSKHDMIFALRFTQHWEQNKTNNGIVLSLNSQNWLYRVWANPQTEIWARGKALQLWATTGNDDNIEMMTRHSNGEDKLYNQLIVQRIKKGDTTALGLYHEIINNNLESSYYWQFARDINPKIFIDLIDAYLEIRKNKVSKVWGKSFLEVDFCMPQIIIKLPHYEAEALFVKHWEHLKCNGDYILGALYVATDKLCSLVENVVSQHATPTEVFESFGSAWGLKTVNHPGITRFHQLMALSPYIKYLSEHDLGNIYEVCNKYGWFKYREDHIDRLLLDKGKLLYGIAICKSRRFQHYNNCLQNIKAKEKHPISIYYGYIEVLVRLGVSDRNILESLFEWLWTLPEIDFDVAKMMLAIIDQIGERKDYQQFVDLCPQKIIDNNNDFFSNTFYSLKRKQLQ
jgi:hypothetical protein